MASNQKLVNQQAKNKTLDLQGFDYQSAINQKTLQTGLEPVTDRLEGESK